LRAQAYEEIKAQEDEKFKAIEQKYDADITLLKEGHARNTRKYDVDIASRNA
jgi:hypothetical protein